MAEVYEIADGWGRTIRTDEVVAVYLPVDQVAVRQSWLHVGQRGPDYATAEVDGRLYEVLGEVDLRSDRYSEVWPDGSSTGRLVVGPIRYYLTWRLRQPVWPPRPGQEAIPPPLLGPDADGRFVQLADGQELRPSEAVQLGLLRELE